MNRHPKLTVAIDTVTEPATLALYADSAPLLMHQVFGSRMVLAELGSFLERASSAAERAAEPIGTVAVSVGPGSFSGSRIGVAAAKAFAKARGARVLVFDHLEALAHAAAAEVGEEVPLVVLDDARRGQWHFFRFGDLGGFSRTLDSDACEARLVELGKCRVVACTESIGAKVAVDDGVQLCQDALSRLAAEPLGRYLAELAELRAEIAPELVEVRYVREYEALAKFAPGNGA